MIPKYIFIVPYRDRAEHKVFFDVFMKYLMEDYDISEYEIVFAHQIETTPFNRGAMKNIGFLYIKKKYPEYYKNIIFIFNDIDTLPYTKNLLDFNTSKGEIKHFYGYKFALGGIFSITGEDFENLNGFPNYWAWGFEDNVMFRRAISNNVVVNRDIFYTIGSRKILHFIDAWKKSINANNLERETKRGYVEIDGLDHLKNVQYNYNKTSGLLDISSFGTLYSYQGDYMEHSIFDGSKIKSKKKQLDFRKMNIY